MNEVETARPVRGRISFGKLLSLFIIAVVVYCCVYSLVVKAVKGETLPMPLGFGVGVVLSGSMEPAYSVNDLILVVKAPDYAVGDVVVFQNGASYTVHRIIEVEDGGIITTQGDANNTADSPITASRIKGRVLLALPFVGAVMRFLKTVPGMIMILVALVVLLLLSLRSRAQQLNEENKNDELQRQIAELRERLESSQNIGSNDQ